MGKKYGVNDADADYCSLRFSDSFSGLDGSFSCIRLTAGNWAYQVAEHGSYPECCFRSVHFPPFVPRFERQPVGRETWPEALVLYCLSNRCRSQQQYLAR